MIKIIAFDADDTLWVNEPYFQDVERRFCELLSDFADPQTASQILFEVEMQNLEPYGYGVKAFTLSLIEAALRISERKISVEKIETILEFGKSLLDHPMELLDGVEAVLANLSKRFKLVVATKGDLLDQERKLKKSGLASYFDHIEIMSDKTDTHYRKLISHLGIEPHEFLMLGNSLKSDVLPVLNIGGEAIYIPFHTTWEHEKIDESMFESPQFRARYKKVSQMSDCVPWIDSVCETT